MVRELLTRVFPFPMLTSVGMLIFLGFFVGMLIWIFRKGSRRVYDQAANLPFHERN
jgi:cbb3-type cytochrome oxidase subunit 3